MCRYVESHYDKFTQLSNNMKGITVRFISTLDAFLIHTNTLLINYINKGYYQLANRRRKSQWAPSSFSFGCCWLFKFRWKFFFILLFEQLKNIKFPNSSLTNYLHDGRNYCRAITRSSPTINCFDNNIIPC